MKQTAAEVRIDGLAQRYCELATLIDEATKEKERIGGWLKEYMEETGEIIDIEGLPILKLQRVTNYSYDVKSLAENNEMIFRRLLDLGILDVSRTKLKAHSADIGMKVPCIEGETIRLVREKR